VSELLHGAAAVLAVAAAAVALLSAIGTAVMPDPWQRLHFVSPPATLSAFVLALAVGFSGAGAQATLKAVSVAVVLTVSNGVVGHATARAHWVRTHGRWPPRADQARVAPRREPPPERTP